MYPLDCSLGNGLLISKNLSTAADPAGGSRKLPNNEEKDKKIQELYNELQHERERSAAFREQLHEILKNLDEHSEFMSIRVEDISNIMKQIELNND
ncbi:hypothetical protein CsSME_00028595 [Camellia sinensis var. sinensis]